MANAKLVEVLKCLEEEKLQIEMAICDKNEELEVVSEAIQNLRKLINEKPAKSQAAILLDKVQGVKTVAELTEEILNKSTKPLHLNEIVVELSKIRGKPVSRGSVDAGLSRYRKKQGSECKIQSLGGGYYKFQESVADKSLATNFNH